MTWLLALALGVSLVLLARQRAELIRLRVQRRLHALPSPAWATYDALILRRARGRAAP